MGTNMVFILLEGLLTMLIEILLVEVKALLGLVKSLEEMQKT